MTFKYEVKPCKAPGQYDREWCREYCLYYRHKCCYYDPDTKKMMLKIRTYEEELQ